jgi:mono/diheme cytochrome c family protein
MTQTRERLGRIEKLTLLKFCATILAAAIAAGVAGCRAAPTLTPQQAEGRHLYDVGCAHCHEENDLRLKKVPPSLHGVFNRNKLPDGEPATDAEVAQILIAGKGTMPSFAYQMTKEQMDAVVAYLHTGLRDQDGH